MRLSTFKVSLLIVLQLLVINCHLLAQVFYNTCSYELSMQKQGLIDIKQIAPNILVELKYSTPDNFMKKDVYGCIEKAFLQKKTAEMLSKAQKFLEKIDPEMHLLIYDAARPLSIQKILWASLTQYKPAQRETFVSDPAKGSIHNYGSAVDITIANKNKKAIDMGTKYDYFGELAYPKMEAQMLKQGKLTLIQVNNRQLLRKVMLAAGFSSIKYEWWHFNAMSRSKAKATYKIIE